MSRHGADARVKGAASSRRERRRERRRDDCLDPQNKVMHPYILTKVIGQGSFGKVRMAHHERTGETFAVKVMKKELVREKMSSRMVQREIKIMHKLRHENIVNLHEVRTTDEKLYIFMEYVDGGELFTEIVQRRRLEEPYSRFYYRQLVLGLRYCHDHGVYHRDLKPENLLLCKSKVLKISDFGLSALKAGNGVMSSLSKSAGPSGFPPAPRGGDTSLSASNLLFTQCGTPHYVAPEIITSTEHGYSGAKVDAWACGVILYVLNAGYLPFDAESSQELFSIILSGDVRYPAFFSDPLKDLLSRLLVRDASARYSLADVAAHPWMTMPDAALAAVSNSSVDCIPVVPPPADPATPAGADARARTSHRAAERKAHTAAAAAVAAKAVVASASAAASDAGGSSPRRARARRARAPPSSSRERADFADDEADAMLASEDSLDFGIPRGTSFSASSSLDDVAEAALDVLDALERDSDEEAVELLPAVRGAYEDQGSARGGATAHRPHAEHDPALESRSSSGNAVGPRPDPAGAGAPAPRAPDVAAVADAGAAPAGGVQKNVVHYATPMSNSPQHPATPSATPAEPAYIVPAPQDVSEYAPQAPAADPARYGPVSPVSTPPCTTPTSRQYHAVPPRGNEVHDRIVQQQQLLLQQEEQQQQQKQQREQQQQEQLQKQQQLLQQEQQKQLQQQQVQLQQQQQLQQNQHQHRGQRGERVQHEQLHVQGTRHSQEPPSRETSRGNSREHSREQIHHYPRHHMHHSQEHQHHHHHSHNPHSHHQYDYTRVPGHSGSARESFQASSGSVGRGTQASLSSVGDYSSPGAPSSAAGPAAAIPGGMADSRVLGVQQNPPGTHMIESPRPSGLNPTYEALVRALQKQQHHEQQRLLNHHVHQQRVLVQHFGGAAGPGAQQPQQQHQGDSQYPEPPDREVPSSVPNHIRSGQAGQHSSAYHRANPSGHTGGVVTERRAPTSVSSGEHAHAPPGATAAHGVPTYAGVALELPRSPMSRSFEYVREVDKDSFRQLWSRHGGDDSSSSDTDTAPDGRGMRRGRSRVMITTSAGGGPAGVAAVVRSRASAPGTPAVTGSPRHLVSTSSPLETRPVVVVATPGRNPESHVHPPAVAASTAADHMTPRGGGHEGNGPEARVTSVMGSGGDQALWRDVGGTESSAALRKRLQEAVLVAARNAAEAKVAADIAGRRAEEVAVEVSTLLGMGDADMYGDAGGSPRHPGVVGGGTADGGMAMSSAGATGIGQVMEKLRTSPTARRSSPRNITRPQPGRILRSGQSFRNSPVPVRVDGTVFGGSASGGSGIAPTVATESVAAASTPSPCLPPSMMAPYPSQGVQSPGVQSPGGSTPSGAAVEEHGGPRSADTSSSSHRRQSNVAAIGPAQYADASPSAAISSADHAAAARLAQVIPDEVGVAAPGGGDEVVPSAIDGRVRERLGDLPRDFSGDREKPGDAGGVAGGVVGGVGSSAAPLDGSEAETSAAGSMGGRPSIEHSGAGGYAGVDGVAGAPRGGADTSMHGGEVQHSVIGTSDWETKPEDPFQIVNIQSPRYGPPRPPKQSRLACAVTGSGSTKRKHRVRAGGAGSSSSASGRSARSGAAGPPGSGGAPVPFRRTYTQFHTLLGVGPTARLLRGLLKDAGCSRVQVKHGAGDREWYRVRCVKVQDGQPIVATVDVTRVDGELTEVSFKKRTSVDSRRFIAFYDELHARFRDAQDAQDHAAPEPPDASSSGESATPSRGKHRARRRLRALPPHLYRALVRSSDDGSAA